MTTWCEDRGEGVIRLKLALQPGAKKSEILGLHDNCLKIKIVAPPVDGAANEALIVFLAKLLGIKQRQVQIVSGKMSRRKMVDVHGVSLENVQELFAGRLG